MKRPQHICATCVRHPSFGGCCTLKRSELATQIPITLADVERIEKRTGWSRSDFADVRRIPPEIKRIHHQAADLLGRATPAGFAISLKVVPKNPQADPTEDEDLACIFLKDGQGCTLGQDRPVVCKLFPFWPDAPNKLLPEPTTENAQSVCLAVHMAKGDYDMVLALMGVADSEVQQLSSQAVRDIARMEKEANK